MAETASTPRRSQAERRERSRSALLAATARAISRSGYAQLSLQAVAAEAGYSRGALYHHFADKDALVLAAVQSVHDTWYAEVAPAVIAHASTPLERLIAVARRHAVYCRQREIAAVMTMLRVEFADRDHPIGDAVRAETQAVVNTIRELILDGRRRGEIAPGTPATVLAHAIEAAVESGVMAIAGHPAHDRDVAERIVRGLLGVDRHPAQASVGVER